MSKKEPIRPDSRYQSRVKRAWNAFVAGRKIADDSLPVHIVESWKICRDHGVDPFTLRLPAILTPAEFANARLENQLLLDAAQPMLKLLEVSIKDTGHIATLSLASGLVLEVVGDGELVRLQADKHYNFPGACRDVVEMGATAMSTCLTLGTPVEVVGYEHYHQADHEWKCAAAPICDHNNEAFAALNLSSGIDRGGIHTLLLAQACADGISTGIRERVMIGRQQTLTALLESVLDSVPEIVIAVDHAGAVIHANEKALEHFFEREGDIKGKPAAAIFSVEDRERAAELIASGAAKTASFNLNARQGAQMHICRFEPILPRDGKFEGTILSISPKKQAIDIANQVGGNYAAYTFDDIMGKSPALERQIELAKRAAKTGSRILVTGESGTGKEMFTQAIHNESLVADGPFVAVSAAAIPRDLIESELFGYVGGAFTGARKGGMIGKMELANGGTFFLDEVNSLPLDMQAKLLRVLQQKQIYRIGDTRPIPFNARVIAASNVNLADAVRQGLFREDLYFRLNVVDIVLPPLRERKEDIPLLVGLFFEKQANEFGIAAPRLSDGALGAFINHEWPGNIRELENACERSILFSNGGTVEIEHLPQALQKSRPLGDPAGGSGRWEQTRNALILASMEKNDGNLTRAAKELGVARTTLYRRLKKIQETSEA